ncbi:unnamed protein product [Trifolium pratense]|uniref:Uncharacterized protein n=1 Tax=Trifolium pratense TaxID=57577 RepID=A0ACB0ISC9_TRIPR|nr:unnamed protein product [Trifolium pratense]
MSSEQGIENNVNNKQFIPRNDIQTSDVVFAINADAVMVQDAISEKFKKVMMIIFTTTPTFGFKNGFMSYNVASRQPNRVCLVDNSIEGYVSLCFPACYHHLVKGVTSHCLVAMQCCAFILNTKRLAEIMFFVLDVESKQCTNLPRYR